MLKLINFSLDLGPEFVYEALRTDATASAAAQGRTLRFLANVDPVDVSRALTGLSPETTLVVVVSKTFTTAETMVSLVLSCIALLANYSLLVECSDGEGVAASRTARY